MKQNILITGGAGYKGVILAKMLLENNYRVTILDNFMYGYHSVLHLLDHKNLSVIKLDIRNVNNQVLQEFDVIFHLAGLSGYPACEANPHSAQMINVEATKKMIKLLSKEQCIIYASTTSFYGKSGNSCDENSPINPVSLYGKTKYEAEMIVQERENSISLRFATIFGTSPKMRADLLVNDFVYKARNERSLVIFDGFSRRTFVHIKDAIRAYIFALDRFEQMKGNVFNIGSNDLNLTKTDIAMAIKKYIPFEIIDSTLPDFDLRNFEISFEKIGKLGYSLEYSLDDGIKDLLKLYSFYSINQSFNII
jgi:nucleoside-diphosphate-sugar epimerase